MLHRRVSSSLQIAHTVIDLYELRINHIREIPTHRTLMALPDLSTQIISVCSARVCLALGTPRVHRLHEGA